MGRCRDFFSKLRPRAPIRRHNFGLFEQIKQRVINSGRARRDTESQLSPMIAGKRRDVDAAIARRRAPALHAFWIDVSQDFFFFAYLDGRWQPVAPVTGTGISRYRYRHRHPVPDRYRIHPVPYPVPPLTRYRHPELDDGIGYWVSVRGWRYREIPVPDDVPDDGSQTLPATPTFPPDRQIYPNLLKPPDPPQPFKKVVRSNPAAQLASTSSPQLLSWHRRRVLSFLSLHSGLSLSLVLTRYASPFTAFYLSLSLCLSPSFCISLLRVFSLAQPFLSCWFSELDGSAVDDKVRREGARRETTREARNVRARLAEQEPVGIHDLPRPLSIGARMQLPHQKQLPLRVPHWGQRDPKFLSMYQKRETKIKP